MKRTIEPGLLPIFRYFTGIAMIYFAALVIFTAIQTGEGDTPTQLNSYVNFGINLALFGYLSWNWLRRKLKQWYLPLALASATVIPIFSNLIYLAESPEDLSITITRSWLLLPILLVPLVLIAWQYEFRYVVIFVLASALVEMSVLYPQIGEINFQTMPILGVPLIRAFAFGTVGHIVTLLVNGQRAQRRELVRANIKLGQHANTLEQLATSRERNRLARELHDTLAHTLSGQAVNLEAIKLMLPSEQTEAHAMLEHSLSNTRSGLAETRRALKDLRSKQLEDLGLMIAVRNLATEAASRAEFALSCQISDHLPELTPDVEQCLYRIAQETLENIVRHADAQKVTLQLKTEDRTLILTISDDGCGFDPQNVDFADKLGIQGMRERAILMSGNLEVHSHSTKGTSVQLSIPIAIAG
ncbi:MAG: sensor histidine kinase [Chloroflexota bacterium]